MLNRLSCAAIVIIAIASGACVEGEPVSALEPAVVETAVGPKPVAQSERPGTVLSEPPFEYLDQLVELADLAVIARIEDVRPLTEAAAEAGGKVWYQSANAVVERVIFGPQLETVTVQNVLYSGPKLELRFPTRAPTFEPGERALIFLTMRSHLFEPSGSAYETVGGGVLWGKFAITDGSVSGRSPINGPRPLEEVVLWIREARDALARPGLLAGTISGLDPGDRVTLRLVRMDATGELREAETLDTWTTSNGPWERDGLKLRFGYYGIVAETAGYLPMTRRHMFSVPDEGITWRYVNLDVEMFHPEVALKLFGEPLCGPPGAQSSNSSRMPLGPPIATPPEPIQPGTGDADVCYGGYLGEPFHIPRGIRGSVGLPTGVTGIVRIERVPRDPGIQYFGGPFSPDLKYPQELTPVEDLQVSEPIETVAALKVDGGRWGLVDPSLGGYPYLVTLEVTGVAGPEVRPPGYQVVVLGGKVPHLVRGVNFVVQMPAPATYPTLSPPGTPDLTAISKIPISGTPTPTAPYIDSTRSDIVFEMKDRYRLGEPVEIRIRNQSPTATYFYQVYYPACYNLKFFDSSTESRPYPHEDPKQPTFLLVPGQFIVPKGTHCDLIFEQQLRPGEVVVLFTWNQDVCMKDRWGCVESDQVVPGEYRVEGEFSQSRRLLAAGSDRKGAKIAVVEWQFTIESPGD